MAGRVSAGSIYMSVEDGSGCAIRRLFSGNYVADGEAYESYVMLLSLSNDPYVGVLLEQHHRDGHVSAHQ
jgi:hypothetical protein